MNLKEGFRYQNFIGKMMSELQYYMADSDCLFETKKVHKRKEANPEAEDFTEIVESDTEVSISGAITFMKDLLEERIKLTEAINMAKAAADVDIDALVEGNKIRQQMCERLRTMLSKRGSKRNYMDKGYKFNAEGNHVPYFYKVEETKTPRFNRKKVRVLLDELNAKSEYVSSLVDKLRINVELNFKPSFNAASTFDEIMELYSSVAADL